MAGERNKKVTTSEWATWLPAPQALTLAQKAIGGRSTTIQVLISRLAENLVRAAAEHSSIDGVRGESPTVIPAELWAQLDDNVEESHLWSAGDLRVLFGRVDKTHRYFGVRFDRHGIGAVLTSAGKGVKDLAAPTGDMAVEQSMAKGQQRSNKEARKPKKVKVKTIAAKPSQKGASRGLENLKND